MKQYRVYLVGVLVVVSLMLLGQVGFSNGHGWFVYSGENQYRTKNNTTLRHALKGLSLFGEGMEKAGEYVPPPYDAPVEIIGGFMHFGADIAHDLIPKVQVQHRSVTFAVRAGVERSGTIEAQRTEREVVRHTVPNWDMWHQYRTPPPSENTLPTYTGWMNIRHTAGGGGW